MKAGAEGETLVTIVEDDTAIAEGLALNLRLQGYRTHWVSDGESARVEIEKERPDLVLLDITLPKQSGLWVLERLREAGNPVPVIVLSAREDEYDKVGALMLGADDYVTKPFALAELLSRVAAVLRRSRMTLTPPAFVPSPKTPLPTEEKPIPVTRYVFGEVEVDIAKRTVLRAGKVVKLTHREFELLAFFCQSNGRVYSREQLVHQVWGLEYPGQARTVDNFVAQLRGKLETDPESPAHFLTVRGSGYRFSVG